jgi:cyclohexadienyl dehydratase
LAAILARGELRVGTTGDYKPFSFVDARGVYHGADIAMAQRLAVALKVHLVFVPTTWSLLLNDFAASRFDVAMGGITVLPARAAVGAFTPPVYVDGKRPIARCTDRNRFTSIAAIDRPEVRVIVNPGASNEQFARSSFPHAQLRVHGDNASVFDEILAGRADVMVTDGIEVAQQSLLHPELCGTDVPAPFTRLEKAYWMTNDPALIEAVDTWLRGEMESGAWERILAAALHDETK